MKSLFSFLFLISFFFLPITNIQAEDTVVDGDGNVHHAGLVEPSGWYNKAVLLGKVHVDSLLRDVEIPEEYDPRGILFGSNIPSLNQGNCGSCYAFAGATTIFSVSLPK